MEKKKLKALQRYYDMTESSLVDFLLAREYSRVFNKGHTFKFSWLSLENKFSGVIKRYELDSEIFMRDLAFKVKHRRARIGSNFVNVQGKYIYFTGPEFIQLKRLL